MKQIDWTPKARKQLKKLPNEVQLSVVVAVKKLVDFPNCQGDIKKLQGMDGYRLRVGRYRVTFDDFGQIIEIEEVKKRDSNTYK
jgi:mRNA interferase RelE/StbE